MTRSQICSSQARSYRVENIGLKYLAQSECILMLDVWGWDFRLHRLIMLGRQNFHDAAVCVSRCGLSQHMSIYRYGMCHLLDRYWQGISR